jgi:hypothetical protein
MAKRKRTPPGADPLSVPLDDNPYRRLQAAGGPTPPAAADYRQLRQQGLHIPGVPDDLAGAEEEAYRRRVQLLVAEVARRRMESLNLYQPLPAQARFHESRAQIRLARGSNRGGKTLPSAVEVARAVTGQDPHRKYPLTDGVAFLVGKDGRHLGDVMYRKLFKARPFDMIRDEHTGLWRVFRPNDPYDKANAHKRKPAPPLIPQRFVKEIGWENKKGGVPQVVRLHNGWELKFFSSLGKPPQGSAIDLVWLDEEIVDPEWVPEMQARLLDFKGRMIWSATPQAGTEHLYDLHERAVEDEELPPGERQVEEFVILLSDNQFMDDKAKEDFAKNMRNEDEYNVRIGGEFAVNAYRVYPEYGDRHVVKPFDIPRTWTRYMFVDPGRQRCAVLFLAVPPATAGDHAGHVYAYDELYIKDSDARKFAKLVQDKIRDWPLQAMWMDMREGRKVEHGSGRSIHRQYSRALAKRGVRTIESGTTFNTAPDDLKGGIEAVRDWLTPDEDGAIKLRVFDTCKNLDKEMRRYHYKRVKGLPTDEPEKKNDHLCDDLRYAAAIDPPYVKPSKKSRTPSGLRRLLATRQAQRRKNSRKPGAGRRVNLGPGR